jgi:hypothetical protein
MSLENVLRCQHLKINGTQCKSPALRRRRLCFFHVRARDQHARMIAAPFAEARFQVPVLEDANAIQLAIMQVMQMVADHRMDYKAAGIMLYALQTATLNLRNTNFEPEMTDVVINRRAVARTSLNGPQWSKEDFGEEENENESKAMTEPNTSPVPIAKQTLETAAEPTSAQPHIDAKNQAEMQKKPLSSKPATPPKKPSHAAPNPAPNITISAHQVRKKCHP